MNAAALLLLITFAGAPPDEGRRVRVGPATLKRAVPAPKQEPEVRVPE